MTARLEPATDELRIDADEIKARLQSGMPITFLDARNDKAWEATPVKIRGAVRLWTADWHIDPSWPRDRLAVVY